MDSPKEDQSVADGELVVQRQVLREKTDAHREDERLLRDQ